MKQQRLKKILLIISSLPLTLFALSALVIVWDGLTDHLDVADVAVVLGNTVERDGQPSARLQARLDKAVELYKQGWFAHIIVSGGLGREGYDEATVMKAYLINQGIPAAQIYVDSQGNNTYLTARNVARIIEENRWRSVLIISQYFHISRTRLALTRFGISPLYSAHANIFEWRDLYSIPREVVGFYSYFLRSYRIQA
jgi:vancomycin permeability regulator SanA